MAINPLPLFFLSFSLALFPSIFAQSFLLTPKTTTLLDVETSLQQTKQVLSFSSRYFHSHYLHRQIHGKPSLASSLLSLQLHSPASLYGSRYKDYASLVLGRLKLDSARVNSLYKQLEMTMENDSNIFYADETGYTPEDLNSSIVSGTNQGSGQYFSVVGVGNPVKLFNLFLDTNGDVNWLQCKPCVDCYEQSDEIYDPNSSSSYSSLSCDSPQCRALEVSDCLNGTCLYQISYEDGSFTTGEFITETLSFGNASIENVSLGCGHDNEGSFSGASGSLGLGGGPLSFTSQINASSFSYCLVDRDSDNSSSLEFNSEPPEDSITASLVRKGKFNTFYYVGLTGISVGGELLSIPPSVFETSETSYDGIVIDSGTAITRLRTEAYEILRDAFMNMTEKLPRSENIDIFDLCYNLTLENTTEVPTVSFHFEEGQFLTLPVKSYLIPVDSDGIFCFAFAPTKSRLSIIGNVQQQGTRVSFDLANSLVGFSPSAC